jgi:hypothetical protein
MTAHERIDGCRDLTPDDWRQLHGPLPGEANRGLTRQQVVARYRAEFVAASGGGHYADPPLATLPPVKARKLSGAPIGRPRQPVANDRGEHFPSARAASRSMGRCDAAVAVAIGRGAMCGGRTWRYLTDEEVRDAANAKLSA